MWLPGKFGRKYMPQSLQDLESPVDEDGTPRDGTLTLAMHRVLGGRCQPGPDGELEDATRCVGCVQMKMNATKKQRSTVKRKFESFPVRPPLPLAPCASLVMHLVAACAVSLSQRMRPSRRLSTT